MATAEGALKVSKDGNTYKAFKITGPTHNFLALEIVDTSPENISVEGHRMGPEEPTGIDGEQLVKTVQKVVAQANALCGLELYLKKIQYIVTDTPDMEQYQHLAQEILTAAVKDFGV